MPDVFYSIRGYSYSLQPSFHLLGKEVKFRLSRNNGINVKVSLYHIIQEKEYKGKAVNRMNYPRSPLAPVYTH